MRQLAYVFPVVDSVLLKKITLPIDYFVHFVRNMILSSMYSKDTVSNWMLVILDGNNCHYMP